MMVYIVTIVFYLQRFVVSGEWIQADFGDTFLITAILTRGSTIDYAGNGHRYTTEFTLHWSITGQCWVTIQNADGSDMVFDGNEDIFNTKRNDLSVITRFIRFVVVQYVHHPVVKWEFEGCLLN